MVLLLHTACSRPIPVKVAPEPAISTETTPCPLAETDAKLRTWRQVQATGFTFCIPADWSAQAGSKRWSRDAKNYIEWGTGTQLPASEVTRITVITERRATEGPPPPSSMRLPPGVETRHFTETIDGRLATLFFNKIQSEYRTGARWTKQPAMFIIGHATSEDAGGVQMQVYRTVRQSPSVSTR
jgi:hypothetical protein